MMSFQMISEQKLEEQGLRFTVYELPIHAFNRLFKITFLANILCTKLPSNVSN